MGGKSDFARIATGRPILSAPPAELSVGQGVEGEFQLNGGVRRSAALCWFCSDSKRQSETLCSRRQNANWGFRRCPNPAIRISAIRNSKSPIPIRISQIPQFEIRNSQFEIANPYLHSCFGYLRCSSCLIFG